MNTREACQAKRRRVAALIKAAKHVSLMAWRTPVGKSEPYLEVSKTVMRRLDRAIERLNNEH